ncbi:MAG: phosphomannomutase/phosphoglucomutase [Clostridia bacterium]|nr:phosphomannomutase/phosphoglucomutase [Clostridia bacterium]
MLNDFWSKLKSGSDIRGTAIEDKNHSNFDLTNDVIEKICIAFAKWLSKKNNLEYKLITIAIGHDSRISANRIKNASINSLRNIGVNVYDCSLMPTPAMMTAISILDCTGAIEITASHHPKNKNGLKFFTIDGGLSDNDIEEILEIAQNEEVVANSDSGNVRTTNIMKYYEEKLKNIIIKETGEFSSRPLEGLKIVVDAGNGAGGFFVENVLKPLGADTTGSIFLNPDGNFPNHIPNPEDKNAIECIVDATKKANADIGIIFDTDVDRVAFVDECGKEITKDRFIALISYIALENNKNGIIVTDSVTSDNLKVFIENIGGNQFRYKRGYHNVIEMAKIINKKGTNCPLAIESSGHAAFKENNFIDDGAFLAAKVVAKLVNLKNQNVKLSYLTKNLVSPKETASLRVSITGEYWEELAEKVLSEFKNYANSKKIFTVDNENIEGVRISLNSKHHNAWAILRRSIHDPVIVIYAESYNIGALKQITGELKEFFKKYDFIKF